jgi:hypothetical protein
MAEQVPQTSMAAPTVICVSPSCGEPRIPHRNANGHDLAFALQTLVVDAFDTTRRLKEMLQSAGLLVPNMLPCKLIQVGSHSMDCRCMQKEGRLVSAAHSQAVMYTLHNAP